MMQPRKTIVDIGVPLLAAEIVLKAIDDWKLLSKGHTCKSQYCTFRYLRQFFRSDWCDLLLIGTHTTGAKILEDLEKNYPSIKEKRSYTR